MEDVVAAKRWLLNYALDGSGQIHPNQYSHDFNRRTLEQHTLSGLEVVEAESGRIVCSFVVPKHLSDADGNWHPGAIATMMDNVSEAAVIAGTGKLKSSVVFSISYLSPEKIHEEVEIEARTTGHKGKLAAVVCEVRKKRSGRTVAVAKQWMSGSTPIKSHL